MRFLSRKPTATTSRFPPEPPVGALAQEIYGNGDLWRRTLGGWQMFNRYDGTWIPGGISWERMHECGLTLVAVDITASSKEAL